MSLDIWNPLRLQQKLNGHLTVLYAEYLKKKRFLVFYLKKLLLMSSERKIIDCLAYTNHILSFCDTAAIPKYLIWKVSDCVKREFDDNIKHFTKNITYCKWIA